MSSLARASARCAVQARSFASKSKYKTESPVVWKDGSAATPTFGEVGGLKSATSKFSDVVAKSKAEVSDAAATELRSANYLFGNLVQHTRGIKVAKDESKRVGLASATPAQAEQGKKVVKLMKAVALPKVIKDGWRAGLANSLFAFGSISDSHAAIKSEFSTLLTGLHSSQKVADYFRFQVNPVSRVQAATGLLEKAGASPLFVQLFAQALQQGYLKDLEIINDHYLELLSMGNKEIKGVVVSADPLDKDEMDKVRAALVKTLPGQKLVLDFKVDETVLGGLSVQVGTNYADFSLRKRLNALVDNQSSEGGEMEALVKPSGVTPAAYAWAAEDVAAEQAALIAKVQGGKGSKGEAIAAVQLSANVAAADKAKLVAQLAATKSRAEGAAVLASVKL